MLRRAVFTTVLLSASLSAAAEPSKQACVDAYAKGQEQRKGGALVEARDAFRTCSAEACPGLVRNDCVQWLSEVEVALPSIVVAVRDAQGRDVPDASVFLDDKPVAGWSRGRAIELSPGQHRLRVERGAGSAVEQSVVASVGEKNRLIRITAPEPVTRTSPAALPTSDSRSGPPTWSLIVGGLGLGAIGGGAVVDVTASSRLRSLRDDCAPRCTESEVDSVKRQMLIGDVLIAVGAIAVGVATWGWLGAERQPAGVSASASRGEGVAPRPLRMSARLRRDPGSRTPPSADGASGGERRRAPRRE